MTWKRKPSHLGSRSQSLLFGGLTAEDGASGRINARESDTHSIYRIAAPLSRGVGRTPRDCISMRRASTVSLSLQLVAGAPASAAASTAARAGKAEASLRRSWCQWGTDGPDAILSPPVGSKPAGARFRSTVRAMVHWYYSTTAATS